jgi:hypothetical protein
MASVLKITDGTTTVDFLATPAVYRVARWQPAVATLRNGELGGRGPFNDVAEVMEISIKSSTPLVDLAVLQDLLDQAQRWGKGEPVSPVLLHYQPGSGSEELRTVIMGAVDDSAMIELPPNFTLALATGILDGLIIRFRRTGLWFGGEDTYDSGTATTMPAVLPVAIPDLNPIGYPVKLRLEGITGWSSNAFNAFILMSSASSSDVADTKIKLLGGVSFNSTTDGFSSVNDSSNFPSNGSTVLRYTPANANVTTSLSWTASNIDADTRRWGVFINYRNNHASTSFKVRMILFTPGTSAYTPYLEIPGGVSNPAYVYMGAVALPGGITNVQIEIQASSAAGSLDIDAVCLISLDSPRTSRVVVIGESDSQTSLSANDLIIDHRLLSHLSPTVYFDESGDVFMPYRGDMTIFLKDVYVYFTCLVCGGSQNPTDWRPSNGTTVYTNKWYVTARTAYLIPE